MRSFVLGLAVMALSFVVFTGARAGGANPVTLKGKVTCAKCELNVAKKCNTVIVTKDDGKDVITYFDVAGHKKHHGETCQTPKTATVTGVVTVEGGKRTIAVSSLKYE